MQFVVLCRIIKIIKLKKLKIGLSLQRYEKRMAKTVRLSDIAQVVGVSTVTVSKALSGQKGVSDEMRMKIKELADQMGYRPLSVSKAQKNNTGYNIGVIISDKFFDKYNSFYWIMYQEVSTKALAKGCFTMLEVINRQNEEELSMPVLLSENKVDGLIIIGVISKAYLDMLVEKTKVPFMCLDFYDDDQHYDAVVTDNFFGMYRMTNHLFEMGHTKIGYVGTLLATNSITDRYFGYCKSLLEHHQTVNPEWIIHDRQIEDGRAERFEMVLPEDLPTAFACNCDIIVPKLIEALEKRGLKVPDDISVVGFDNYLFPGMCNVGVTTYEVDVKEMARIAVVVLLKKMSGEHYKKGISIVPGKCVYKESVRRI